MDELIKYIEGKLNCAKFMMEHAEKDARHYAHNFEHQAYGAVEFFLLSNYQTHPDLTKKMEELWSDTYRPQFENLIWGLT
jgi:hypothetical protein